MVMYSHVAASIHIYQKTVLQEQYDLESRGRQSVHQVVRAVV